MLPDPLEGSACPSVVRIPVIVDAGVGLLLFTYEGEDSQPIHHHRQCVSLDHSLLAEKEVTRPITLPDHQRGPVVVSVECEPRTTGPHKLHCPQHGCAVLLIERITRANEEEPPILVLGVLLPQEPHRVDTPLISDSRPPQSFSVPQASLASAPITTNAHFSSIRRQVSTMPTGLTSGHLLRAMRRPDTSAL